MKKFTIAPLIKFVTYFILAIILVTSSHLLAMSSKTDFQHESHELATSLLYKRPSSLYNVMAPSGANAVNAQWEKKEVPNWYIEAQKTGEEALIGGLVRNNKEAIEAGFKMFNWGFARQISDGSFGDTAGYFHGTSFFVQAVARSLLVIQQSPYASEYAYKISVMTPWVHKAARWMISPTPWSRGTQSNKPYLHRYYLVAAALGLSGKLTNDPELINYARQLITEALPLQQPDGINPEKGGFDSSYQMAGVLYATRWLVYFPNDPLNPSIVNMIQKALEWEKTRILPTGEISNDGNSRTGGQEIRLTGQTKNIDQRLVYRTFAYWYSLTGEEQWKELAKRISKFYYGI